MLEFIQTLLHSYQRALKQNPHDSNLNKFYPQCIDQLILAEALLRKNDLTLNFPKLPLQIAIIGPTQVGKSTLVNTLLKSASAKVSPLAGYTMHPQGFCHGLNIARCTGLQNYFGRFQQLSQSLLNKERFDCYSLTEIASDAQWLPECVIWDSPDFDSIDAQDYKEGVLRTIALADIIILTVSKEKYADQSVWDIMSALAPLKQPTLLCLNKLVPGTESLIINSLRDKWQNARQDAFPEIVPLFYQKPDSELIWPEQAQTLVLNLFKSAAQRKPVNVQQSYFQHHWQVWLKPVYAELVATKEWQALCESELKQAISQYQRDYLNHPQHYATFQNALAELLNLLEIPGMATVLANTRKVITWPVKQLLKLGGKSNQLANKSQEVLLLNQIAEHWLIQLADHLLDKTNQSNLPLWWKDLALQLRRQRPELLSAFQVQINAYHERFKLEIAHAAQRVYHKLQEQPLVLNSLRATRATTDAAMIALSIKTGGFGLQDLLFAPAMLAVTSLLTESAMGSYMKRVEAELKVQQLQTVRALFEDLFQQKLIALPSHLSAQRHFNITPQQLQLAEQHLTDKKHGLRFL